MNGMKLLDRPKLEAAYVVFSTVFDMALQNTPVIYPSIATVIPNAGPVNQFNWLGDVPVMQKWLGNRVINRLRAEKHTLYTDWYANGIELDYDDVNEDRLGIVAPRIQDLASMGPRKIDAMVIDMLVNGFAGTLGLTYDGQYLFDSDHTADGSGTGIQQSNLGASGALSSTTFNAALTQGMGFVSTNGEPLQRSFDTILAGPTNQLTVRSLLTAAYGTNGATNVDQGMAKAIINARINGASHKNKWFLLDTSSRVRAVLVGIEVPPTFAELMGFDNLHMFMHRTGLAGAHMKVGLAYGLWQTAIGSLGT